MGQTMQIKNITKVSDNSKRFDLSVKDNHNYFADGILVHNCTMYRDHIHPRSLDPRPHPSRDWVKNFHGEISHKIPEGWRICGENLFAEHSIRYENLPSYFMAFSVWNENNYCLSWDKTVEWCEIIGLEHVPVLYRGPWDEQRVREIGEEMDFENHEGYVVRTADGFPFEEFQSRCAKVVRPNHVRTSEHWMHQEVVPNGLADGREDN